MSFNSLNVKTIIKQRSARRVSVSHKDDESPAIGDTIIIIIIIIIILNLGRSSRGGRQKLILEIIALMVSHPSGSRQQSSRAAG